MKNLFKVQFSLSEFNVYFASLTFPDPLIWKTLKQMVMALTPIFRRVVFPVLFFAFIGCVVLSLVAWVLSKNTTSYGLQLQRLRKMEKFRNIAVLIGVLLCITSIILIICMI